MEMNLNEQIYRIQEMMGLIIEEKKSFENKPIILVGSQGTGKSTTSKALAKKLFLYSSIITKHNKSSIGEVVNSS